MVTPGNPAKLGTPRTELTVAQLSKVPILTPPSFLFPPSSIALAFNVYFEFKQPVQKIIAQLFLLNSIDSFVKGNLCPDHCTCSCCRGRTVFPGNLKTSSEGPGHLS